MRKQHFSFIIVVIICMLSWSINILAAQYDPIVEQVQKKLIELGYDPGPADGKIGQKTVNAIKSFQKDNSLLENGEMNAVTLKKLDITPEEAQPAPEKAAPPPVPKKETKPKDPPKISCGYSGCNVENALNDEMITQIKTHFSENKHAEEVALKNGADEDLKKLLELKDIILKVKLEQSEDITDLTPLSKLTNLTRLALERLPNLTDLTPIGSLTNVTYLSLRELGAPIDLAPVGKMTALEEIWLLDKVEYQSYDFLRPLANLKIFMQYKSKVNPEDPSNISSLAGKPLLERVKFEGSNVSDISPMKDSPELKSLELANSPIEDLSPVQGFPKLEYLRLSKVPVKDLKPIEGLGALRNIVIYGTEVTDLTPLASLKNSLKTLNLNKTNVKDMTPIGELSELIDIFIDETEFADFSPLAKCTKLEFIEARSEKSGFSDLNIIASLPNLKRLWVDGNDKIQNWDALKTMTSLQSLSAGDTSLSDLKVIENLENLEDINLYDCEVKNAETLAKLPKLYRISIRNTKGIDNITFLKDLPSLAKLSLGYATDQFPQDQIDALNKAQEEAKKKQ